MNSWGLLGFTQRISKPGTCIRLDRSRVYPSELTNGIPNEWPQDKRHTTRTSMMMSTILSCSSCTCMSFYNPPPTKQILLDNDQIRDFAKDGEMPALNLSREMVGVSLNALRTSNSNSIRRPSSVFNNHHIVRPPSQVRLSTSGYQQKGFGNFDRKLINSSPQQI